MEWMNDPFLTPEEWAKHLEESGERVVEVQAEGTDTAYGDVTMPVIGGCPQHWAQVLDSNQGDNFLGASNNCGWVSLSNVLNMAGVYTNEDEMTKLAVTNGLCDTSGYDVTQWGGSTVDVISEMMDLAGVPNEVLPAGMTDYEDLAAQVEDGHGVILSHNACLTAPGYENLATCDEYGDFCADHSACVTGTVRDGQTGKIQGFILCDSGMQDPTRFVDLEHMDQGFRHALSSYAIITTRPIHQGGKPLLQGLMGSTPA